MSVAFGASGPAPSAAAMPTLARAPEDGDAEVAPPAPPSTPAPAAAAPPAPGGAGAPPGAPAPTLEDIYDHVVERLRRDLLVERERMGDLIGRLP